VQAALYYPTKSPPSIGTSCRISKLCNTTSTAPFTSNSAIFLKIAKSEGVKFKFKLVVDKALKSFEDVCTLFSYTFFHAMGYVYTETPYPPLIHDSQLASRSNPFFQCLVGVHTNPNLQTPSILEEETSKHSANDTRYKILHNKPDSGGTIRPAEGNPPKSRVRVLNGGQLHWH
jgi:hypothetical protein